MPAIASEVSTAASGNRRLWSGIIGIMAKVIHHLASSKRHETRMAFGVGLRSVLT